MKNAKSVTFQIRSHLNESFVVVGGERICLQKKGNERNLEGEMRGEVFKRVQWKVSELVSVNTV